jgi:high-affinity nickel-transport protein
MAKAYSWAFSSPARKVYYNLTMTTLSVVVALLIGSVELLQALGQGLGLGGSFWSWLGALDFGALGYSIVGLFVATWIVALALWWWGHIEERWQPPRPPSLASSPADP